MTSFYAKTNNGWLVRVRLTPNSSSSRISGLISGPNDEEYLRINIVSVPEKGKANKELIAFLAKQLGLAKTALQIVSGTTNHWKKIEITTAVDLENSLIRLTGE